MLAMAGCGRNPADPLETGSAPGAAAPTAGFSSDGGAPGVPGEQLNPTRYHDAILGMELVIKLRPGIDRSRVFQDYSVDPQEVLDDHLTWRVQVQRGIDGFNVLKTAMYDDRIELIEQNLPVVLPEAQQSSMAFSEGVIPIHEVFDQGVAGRLQLPLAHSVNNGSAIKVAILDTGLNRNHPLFRGRVLPDGYDFVDHDGDPSDLPDGLDNDGDGVTDEGAGHGSHVAGLVTFAAPGARLLPIRVLNSDGVGTAYAVARGIEYAIDHGARIINMSLAMSMSSTTMNNAITLAVSKGVILVCSAGNDGGANPLNYPASDGRVWAVGALDAMNNLASYSAPGAGVVIAAPGEDLLSAYWDGGYASWSGTSMASPLVAGTAALILAQYHFVTPAEVLAKLLETATPIYTAGVLNPDGVGAGMVNPGAALAAFAGSGGLGVGSTEIKDTRRQ